MGYGGYSYAAHAAMTSARGGASQRDVFGQTSCHPLMNPRGVRVRESRDSKDHPDSVPIVFALDVSGSMGEIPHRLATATLPTFMKAILNMGITHPQICFMAVGNAVSDSAPLQVGQFESTAELMDSWLTRTYIEGGGRGGYESYELAMYFTALHTATDAFEKRGRHGYCFITGDEPPNQVVRKAEVQAVLGQHEATDIPTSEIIEELRRSWEPFFLIPDPGRAAPIEEAWRALLGDHVLVMSRPDHTSHVAAGAVALAEGSVAHLGALAERLSIAGVPPGDVTAVVSALAPFAAGLGKRGLPPSAAPTPPPTRPRR